MLSFIKKHSLTIVFIAILVVAVDHGLRKDAAAMCSNEATAYPECRH